MKKIIPLKKELIFNSNLAEVVSIDLEHNLNLDEKDILGNILINGSYKMNDTSINIDEFKFEIPVNIEISERYDLKEIKIDIDNFYYDVVDNNILNVNVDIALNNLIELKEEVKEEKQKIENKEIKDELQVVDNENSDRIDTEDVKTLFDSFDDSIETYATYKVCIVKENDTIDSIMLSYNVTKELLEQYNDLDEIKIGDKIIIPATYEKN